jgi:hypothetical protein
MIWPARPLRSSPITGPSSLLRAGPPLCLASVLSPTWPWPPAVLPLDDQGADLTHFDWPFVSRRQILLFRARACNELTPPLHRTPPGPRAGSSLAPDTPKDVSLSRGRRAGLGFDVIVHIHDASAVVHTRSSSRHSPDPLVAGLLRSRFPPRLLTDMTLRRFGISAVHGEPRGPTSIPDTARFVLAIFYIVTTPLSGRTTPASAVPGVRKSCAWQFRQGRSRRRCPG